MRVVIPFADDMCRGARACVGSRREIDDVISLVKWPVFVLDPTGEVGFRKIFFDVVSVIDSRVRRGLNGWS